MKLHIVILAAGQSKRMKSRQSKVLHTIAGVPLIERVVNTAQAMNPDAIHVIYGNHSDVVRQTYKNLAVNWVLQEEQLGTGHAVQQALAHIPTDARVLVLSADVPLVKSETLNHLMNDTNEKSLGLLVANFENPFGLGRIIRNESQGITAIIEEKDASDEQRKITEIFSGILAAPASALQKWLEQLNNNNVQGEYYLTGVIALAVQEGYPVESVQAKRSEDVSGANTRVELARLERIAQLDIAHRLMTEGVTIMDPARIDVRGDLQVGKDTIIDINAVFEGHVILGESVKIGPNCVLKNVKMGDNVEILANSVLEGAEIAANCVIGPFARIRPGTQLAEGVKVGNFVEIKNCDIAADSKVNHLTYMGDSTVGREVNIGAGTITCNYDGAKKHRTIIKDKVFVGSGTQLVAPVTLNEGCYVGSGSVITKDTEANKLTLSRSAQKTIEGWEKPE